MSDDVEVITNAAVAGPRRAVLLVTVSDEEIFARDVVSSAAAETAAGHVDVFAIRNCRSQASALNKGIEVAGTDLVVCPHQDVSFGAGWLDAFERLAASAPAPWGVLGPAGTDRDGKMWGTHSGLGMDDYQHATAQTLDGSCLVLRRSSGLRFDENLNRFHGYDVDVCLEAQARGLAVYVVNVPMVHNTRWASTAGRGAQDFQDALGYVARKWHGRGVGPIHTTFGTY